MIKLSTLRFPKDHFVGYWTTAPLSKKEIATPLRKQL